jgi:hypothetical protein
LRIIGAAFATIALNLPPDFRETARVLKFFANTQDGKTADADIHTDGGATYRQRLRFRHFTSKESALREAIADLPHHDTRMKPSRRPSSFFFPKRTNGADNCPRQA